LFLFMLSHSFLHLLFISCSTDQTTDYKSAGAGVAVTRQFFLIMICPAK
jgi:hypothetical protein